MIGAARVSADWTYSYADDFTADKVGGDSYRHSPFWSRRAPRPSAPHLYYINTDGDRGLALIDYYGRLAEVGYRFPVASGQARRLAHGVLALDVSFPSDAEFSQQVPGRLECRVSSNGADWSSAHILTVGRQEIAIASASGVCYVLFSGARVVIDNLSLSLRATPVAIPVPRDFGTIQAAIDAAADGDVIEVGPGVYSGPGNRDIQFRGKAITVRGIAGPENTIIDCGGATEGGHRGFYFHEAEGTDSVLSGFTVQSGRVLGSEVPPDPLRWTPSGAHPIGGGIYCEFSSPTIVDCIVQYCGAELGGGIGAVGAAPQIAECVIRECDAGGFGLAESGGRGGAIGLLGCSNVTITNCVLRDNLGYYNSFGAGLYAQRSVVIVANCTLAANSAPSVRGGGAYCAGAGTDVTFRNCVFSLNQADTGAGVYGEWVLDASLPASVRTQRARVSVINCTIARNELAWLGAVAGYAAGIQAADIELVVTGSILWHNTGAALAVTGYGAASADRVVYSDVEGGWPGRGNLNVDPLFADAASEDYHLRSNYGRYDPLRGGWINDPDHSPCVDAGDPTASIGEEPVPNGARVNMGAYGGTKQASKGPDRSILHVDGSGNRPGAYTTIQQAIDASQTGDTILVWPGTYREQLYFYSRAVTVRSAADAAVLTTPGGEDNDYAVSFFSAESSRSVLANFVITGCGKGAVFCSAACPTLKNLTIVGNPGHGVHAFDGSDPNIINCILWNNDDSDLYQCNARYSNIEDGVADQTVGNIKRDPWFADPDNGDYHLRSRAGRYVPQADSWVKDPVTTSPCIDAGDPREDPGREPAPNGGRINMGAYGGTAYASKSG